MHELTAQAVAEVAERRAEGLTRLSQVKPGDRGVIADVRADDAGGNGVDVQELERRLLEFGFVEGASLEVLHEGLLGRAPLALRVDDMRVAVRRRDAAGVWVRLDAQ